MADHSLIEWTDATWNPITGCSIVSPGCTNCYAMKLAGTRLKHIPSRAGLTRDSKAGPVWTGQVRLNEQWLDQPLRWKKPRKIFVCAHGDLFAENVPDEWIVRVVAVSIASWLLNSHTLQILTKRAKRMRQLLNDADFWEDVNIAVADLVRHHYAPLTIDLYGPDNMPSGLWLGVSAEDQQRVDERIPALLATPAAIRFLSAEPLLGPIDFYKTSDAMPINGHPWRNGPVLQGIDWVIAGGESGQGARPMHPQWVRSLRDQCAAAGTAFFFKQWGAFRQLTVAERGQACGATFISGCDRHDREAYVLPASKKRAGRMLDGVEHNAMPEGDRR
jgi:protein gp37